MKRLTLVRHAKSDWGTSAKTDFDRPLNARGKQAAPLMGQRMAARALSPERLISSPAKRAKQTAKRLAKELNPELAITYVESIYEASRKELSELVRNLNDAENQIIFVGHNPGMSELGQWLCKDAPDWLPTCGVLELELSINSWAEADEDCATLAIYDYPKKTV